MLMLTPEAASDNACRNLELSTSVTAVLGSKETLPLAHSKAFTLYARTRAISAYVTVSNRELGRAPVRDAIKILVMVDPRGTMTPSLIDWYCIPSRDFVKSKTSDKKDNMEFEASLCCTVTPTIAQSISEGNAVDGINI